jgi:HSP90 family molecular chaperone
MDNRVYRTTGEYEKVNQASALWARPRSEVTTTEDDEGRRHEFYDDHLAGQPVLDTLQKAVSALIAI